MADYTPEDEETVAPQNIEHGELLSRALKRFDNITEAVQEERALALNDRRFSSIAGAQWEGNWQQAFANSIMVEVNKTAMGVEKIIADYRANRVTVNYRGVGKGADEDTAETLDGMFRADVYSSKGGQAFDNAFDEAVNGGIGAWRLVNVYEDDRDTDNDRQRIAFRAIVDADQSVFFDMNSQTYDKSDARFAFVVTAMTRGAFCEEYGEDAVCDWPDEILKTYYDWFTPDVVRVCEYYEVHDKPAVLRVFRHRASDEERREWAADLDAQALQDMEVEGWREIRTVRRKRRRVMKTILSGAQVLRPPRVIAGECIPIVPVYGKRWFIDNMERTRGHVRLAKDPQRIFNAQIAKLTETAAVSPIERPIFTPQQIAGHEMSWANANLNRSPYALINQVEDEAGNMLPIGPVATMKPPELAPAVAALLQITANEVAELTGSNENADQIRSNVSAEAMDMAATRIDAKSSIFMDNFRQSMQRCGEIYQSMARDVYFEEGREVETLSEDGQYSTAVLLQPVTDERGRYSIRNDLAQGSYKVISDVTEATTTRRDKTVKALMNLSQVTIGVDPELSSVAAATAIINMDGEGMKDFQDWARSRLVRAGVVKPTPEEQEAMDQEAENVQPSAQDQALQAVAQKESALARKAMADTGLSEAKTVESQAATEQKLADAELKQSQARDNSMERKMGVMERVKGFFAPKAPGSRDGNG